MAKILVVDDLPLNVEYLEEELQVLGYEVTTATGGEEALRLVTRTNPDLILLDLSMPVMDGLEVLVVMGDQFLVDRARCTAIRAVGEGLRQVPERQMGRTSRVVSIDERAHRFSPDRSRRSRNGVRHCLSAVPAIWLRGFCAPPDHRGELHLRQKKRAARWTAL